MDSIQTANGRSFFPIQPEIEYIMNDYVEQKPTDLKIAEHIALYYYFNTPKDAINSFSLIPDGCFDIIFCCSKKHAEAFIWTSPIKRSKKLVLRNNCEYFGIRFLPEQSIIKLKRPMRDLLEKTISFNEVVNLDKSLVEEIMHAADFKEKMAIFERKINLLLRKSTKQTIIDYCINKIYSLKGMVNINQLSKDTGYSDRYIRNKFEETVGFSPKQFSEIVRFQNSISMIFKGNQYSMLDVVHENGYHDQAHFIKGFKKFVLLPPSKYKNSIFKISNSS